MVLPYFWSMSDCTRLNLARGWAFKLHVWMPVSRKNVRSPPPTVFKTIFKRWSPGSQLFLAPNSIMPLLLPQTVNRQSLEASSLRNTKKVFDIVLSILARVQFCRNSTPPVHYKMDSLQTETIHYNMPILQNVIRKTTNMTFHPKHPLQDIWVQNINCYKVIHGHQSVSNEACYYKIPRCVWLIIKESNEWPWKKHCISTIKSWQEILTKKSIFNIVKVEA